MDPTKTKVYLTVGLLLIGTVLGCFLMVSDDVSAKQSEGLIIDFADKDVKWTDADLHVYKDPISLLQYACEHNGFSLTLDGTNVKEINGFYSDDSKQWQFWTIRNGSTEWVTADPGDALKDGVVYAWAYRAEGEVPTVAIDSLGNSIYGYPLARSIVSLSPSVTEIMGALGADNALVGTDMYSNYPNSVVEGQKTGEIALVGGYTNPSFEKILDCDADIVLCDGSQYTHAEVSKKLRKNGFNAITTYDGENIETIKTNIFILGTAIGYDIAAESVLNDISDAMSKVIDEINRNPETKGVRTIITLSEDKAPWASGDYTYAHDALESVQGVNVLSDKMGWVHISSELIAQKNPEVAIIITHTYQVSEDEYQALLDNLSPEWRSTDAYKNGNIYLICRGAADMASRSTPRVAQLMELFGLICQPNVFDDSSIPKYIGDNYADYLNYTKYYSYNN